MKLANRMPSAVIFLSFAALVVVPLLAVLQYQWLGQLAGQEYDRIRTGMRIAMFRGAMECNRDFMGLLQAFNDIARASPTSIRRQGASQLANLLSTSAYRRFLTGEVRMVSMPDPESAIRIAESNGSSIFVYRDISMIGLSSSGQPDSLVGVCLDRTYLVEKYIPDLLRSYLGTENTIPVNIVLYDAQRTPLITVVGDKVFEPDEFMPLLVVPRFVWTPAFPDSVGLEFRPFPIDPRDSRPPWIDARRAQSRNSWSAAVDTMVRRDGMRMPLLSAGVSFTPGSLEQVVQSSRLRNLGLSFGVLLLLSVTILLLIRSAAKAQQLAKQQVEFVAGVSHELRTPLAILRSAGENLSDGLIKDPMRAKMYGDIIKTETGRLTQMVEKTLTYAGILSGQETFDRQSVDLPTLLKDAIISTRQSEHARDYEIQLVIEPDVPQLFGDPAVLRSVFLNLLGNAAKYNAHSQRIDVRARTIKEGTREWVLVEIADQGIGIPGKDIGRIFEPFVRAQNATNEQIRGSGLGLSLAKHAVEAHGGSIYVRSEVGKGSVFTTKLPFPHNDRSPKT